MTVSLLSEQYLRSNPLPNHDDGRGKEGRGRVLIIGGSVNVPGAALLAGLGALRSGAGVLQIATCRSVAPHLALAMPEAMVIPCDEQNEDISPSAASKLIAAAEQCDALLIGPGMIDKSVAGELTQRILSALPDMNVLLDAAAFTGMTASCELLRNRTGKTVVTPHAGEMAAFLKRERADIEADPLNAARDAVKTIGAIVVMKGSETHIVDESSAWLSKHGTSALGTSGSGDVLAGVLSGLLARGTTPLLSVLWGVYLHAMAGVRLCERHGRVGLLARELPAEIPRLMEDLRPL